MSATIITNFSGAFEYEPEISTDNSRDGISTFQFKIIGGLTALNGAFQVDEDIVGVPDQPPGSFRVVRRNLEHIAGDPQTGLYRLSISGEGGTGDSNLEITQSNYAYQKEEISGTVSVDGRDRQPANWILEWLSPSVSIITNSRDASVLSVQGKAKRLVDAFQVQVLRDRPTTPNAIYSGARIDQQKIIITGATIEKAGALYRVSATATKGAVEEV